MDREERERIVRDAVDKEREAGEETEQAQREYLD